MKWYHLSFDEDALGPAPFCADEEDLNGVDWLNLKQGKKIENWNPDSWLRASRPDDDGEGDGDDWLCEHLNVPTFSRRLREGLGTVGKRDIQYLPIRVFRSTGKEIQGFCFANIISRVSALDYKHSEMLTQSKDQVDPLTGVPAVTGCWREALLAKPLEEHDVIRLVEFFPPVFVSERFATVWRNLKCTGATLTEVKVS